MQIFRFNSFGSWIYRVIKTRWKIHRYVENITSVIDKEYKRHLLSQCMDRLSSSRLRQTLQNFLLWCTCSDQQCATGFCATEQNLFYFSFFFFFFFRSHRNASLPLYSMKKKLREQKYSPLHDFSSFFESSYSGKKKKNNWLILEFNDDCFCSNYYFFFFTEEKKEEEGVGPLL